MPYKDPQKQKEFQQKHYEQNKEKFKSRMKQRRDEIKEWFWDLKNKYKCEICGEDDFRVLDFHHDNERRYGAETVSQLCHNRLRKDLVIEEIEKCQCLCSNCHRIRHWEEEHNACVV